MAMFAGQQNGYKNILVLEDDVAFEYDKEMFRSILENTFKQIKDNFIEDYYKAINNDYDNWQSDAKESLALIILYQFHNLIQLY